MASSYIGAELRRLVAERADYLCEYCLIHEGDTFVGCQVDHIISEKHGGPTTADNLAYACTYCNRFKGSDLGSLSRPSGDLIRFYNPRKDKWSKHFALNGDQIAALTAVGEVTARILNFNNSERVLEREELRIAGRYPSPAAIFRMSP